MAGKDGSESAPEPQRDGTVSAPLPDVCVALVAEFLEGRCEVLVAAAREELFVGARDATDPDEEDRLLSLMEEVEAVGPGACRRFRDTVLDRLGGGGASATPDPASGGGGLSLVETLKVEDWVRVRRILERHEPALREPQAAVSRAAAAASGAADDAASSPLGLQAICVEFQAALEATVASRECRGSLFDAFEEHLVRALDGLLADVARSLADPAAASRMPPPPAPDPGGDAPPVGDETPAGSGVDPTRLLGGLAAARDAGGEPPTSVEELAARLVQVVAPPGVRLGARERDTARAVAALLHAPLAAPDLDEDLRRRVSRLAVPVMALALQDDALLALELEAARHDAITGLLDRVAFRDRLERALHRAQAVEGVLTVCLVDVDGFSPFLRRFGPQAAGRMLRALADLLRTHAGSAGVASRLRGDEFAVLLDGRAGGGRRFAERYQQALAKAQFAVEGESVRLAVSIGVVEIIPPGPTAADVMRAADVARREARTAGGGRYAVRALE